MILLLNCSKISIVFKIRIPYICNMFQEISKAKSKFEIIIFNSICKQSCSINKIYIYQAKKDKRPNSISIIMFKNVKFICSYARCGKVYILVTILYNKMFKCPHWSILYFAQGCRFINNVKIEYIHWINYFFLFVKLRILLIIVQCFSFDSWLQCYKISPFNLLIFKDYQENSPPNHSHKNAYFKTNLLVESLKIKTKFTRICLCA